MREIKFRGVDKATGKFVFGELSFFWESPTICFDTPEGWNSRAVKPESIQQLIGVDKSGREVYEGDLIGMADGEGIKRPYTATFSDFDGVNGGWLFKCVK